MELMINEKGCILHQEDLAASCNNAELAPLNQTVEVSECEFTNFCFRATPNIIKALIPAGTIGAYVFFNHFDPIYIGRTDSCLSTRLAKHEKLKTSTHVFWRPTSNQLQAYYLEAAWYHSFGIGIAALNKVHPAKPGYSPNVKCPFCEIQKSNWQVYMF